MAREGYKVIIRETLEREVFVPKSKVECEEDALDYVQEQYDSENIVLDSEDFVGTDFICGRIERHR